MLSCEGNIGGPSLWCYCGIAKGNQCLFELTEILVKCKGSAVGGGVREEDSVGQCADEAIAGFGMGCSDALVLWWEWGEDQQTAGVEGGD